MTLQNLVDYCNEFNLEDIFAGVLVPEPLDPEDVKSAIMVRCGLLTPVYSEPSTMRSMIKFWFNSHKWNIEHLINIILAEYNPIENYDRYEDIKVNKTNKETLSGSDLLSASGSDTTQYGKTDTMQYGKTDTMQYGKTDTMQYGKTDTMQHGHTIENQVSAFNTSTYSNSDKEIHSGNDVNTLSGSDTNTLSGNDVNTLSGNDVNTLSGNDVNTLGGSDTMQYGKTDTTTYGKVTDNAGEDVTTAHIHGNIGVTTNQMMIEQELELLKNFNIYDWIASRVEDDLFLTIY